jgi:anti-sigma regulatory factor (Ser/Thr protein kinase)
MNMQTLLHEVTAPEQQQVQPTHCFFNADGPVPLAELLEGPYQHFVEMREYHHLGQVLEFIRNEYPHMSLSLTTRTAFRQPVADLLSARIVRTHGLSHELACNIKTCLQEALMNAIIHGNLGIPHAEPENFHLYLEQVTDAIAHDARSMKRVSAFAWFTDRYITLCVSDQGEGFNIEQSAVDPTVPYGRGLSLIRNMASNIWQNAPGQLHMQFNRHG